MFFSIPLLFVIWLRLEPQTKLEFDLTKPSALEAQHLWFPDVSSWNFGNPAKAVIITAHTNALHERWDEWNTWIVENTPAQTHLRAYLFI